MRSFISIAFLIVAIVSAYYGWQYLSDAENYPITKVVVRGDYQHVNNAKIQKLIMPFTEASFFALDHRGLQKTLLTEPWIASVLIQRVWPDTLQVNLLEEQAVATWNDQGLLTESKRIIEPDLDSFPEGLPKFYGPDSEAVKVMETYHSFQELLAPFQKSLLEVEMTERHTWQLTLDDDVIIELGRDGLQEKGLRLQSSFNKINQLSEKPVKVYDLRYANGIVIRY